MKDDSALTEKFVRVVAEISRGLPEAERYVMVHHPAFRVGKKPYAIIGMESGARNDVTLSINLGPEMQLTLLEDACFTRTPYIGQHGWVTVKQRDLEPKELVGLVERSYRRVAGKKLLARLDAGTPSAAAAPLVPTSKKKPATAAKPAIAAKPKPKTAAKKKPKTVAKKKPTVKKPSPRSTAKAKS